MNELYLDPEAALEVEYVKTDSQKGDSFTKALGPQAFIAAREKLSMRKPQVHGSAEDGVSKGGDDGDHAQQS